MKKRIAGLVSLLMLLNVLFSAAWVHAADYNFVDSAYSPELGVAVAVTRTGDYNNAEIWYSDNLEQWTPTNVGKKSAFNSANKNTKQLIVWWPKEQVFVANLAGTFYISEDGQEWKVNDALKISTNSVIATNGEQLIIACDDKIRVLNDLDNIPEAKKYKSGNYAKAVGSTASAPYIYAITDQWAKWKITPPMDAPELDVNESYGTIGAHPWDMVYSESIEGWILVEGYSYNKDGVLIECLPHYLPNTVGGYSAAPQNGFQLADGGESRSAVTAADASLTEVLLGTLDGQILIAPAAKDLLKGTWTRALPGQDVQPVTTEIGTITIIDENHFMFGTETRFYIAEKIEDTYYYYESDTTFFTVNEEALRIEVPAEGETTVEFTAQAATLLNPNRDITDYAVLGTIPTGISVQNKGNGLEITVSAEAKEGELSVQITADNGMSKNYTITVVDEDHLEIIGPEKLAIPLEGGEDSVYPYSVKVIGTDGQEMNRSAEITVVSALAEGVTCEGGTVIVSDKAKPGEITLRFSSVAKPEIFVERTIQLEERVPSKIEILSGDETVFLNENTTTYNYTARILDQSDVEMPKEKVVWSISKDGGTVSGIEIERKPDPKPENSDQETGDAPKQEPVVQTGILTVKPDAWLDSFTLRAAAEGSETLYTEKEITCVISDGKYINADLNTLQEKLKHIETNTEITKTGEYGTEFSWESTDESVITKEGKIICPSRAGKTVKLTVTGTKNETKKTREIDMEVAKADTLVENGDIELGTTEGWNAEGDALKVSEDAHAGKYALSVQENVYQEVKGMTTDSSYAFTAFVKAPKGTKVEIYSQKLDKVVAQATAKDGYTEIKDSYDYRVKDKTFDDKIYIRADGEFLVDDFKMFEITTEYLEAAKAVANAEYTKKKADVDDARKVVEKFYDLPARDKLIERLDAIKIKSEGGPGGGGHTPSTSSPAVNPVFPAGENQGENDYKDALDTAMLKFKDMKGHWAKEDVEYMAGLELVSGKEEGVFAPDDTVTRAEFAVLVTRAMGLPTAAYENSFFDVIEEDWYSGYVQAAKSAGYMNGSDGLFRPNDPITREEIAKVIVAAYNEKTGTKLVKGGALYFNDIDEIGAWAYDYIVEAVDKGFVAGISEDTFSPKANATRAQAVVMLRRVYDELQGGSKAE